ncbi:CKLF-like MARVEL transmembrane domain-containing protein 5 isoform X2 [Protopterus annectens]|uniref:CKLF-like MARVEL transmembrane domain-containing protein 5 isoform X2 n=1 Tax=Protopterus annectens TaxID=7888 RepID=UPI001CFBD6CC|nr:CKLF-like MARVEL transmembrane domain-containing protein 5 isoform X2 [Protopterus annectens]
MLKEIQIHVVLCFIIFICFAASDASYLAAPLLELLITSVFLFLYVTKYYERFSSLNWPCMDLLRCASAVLIFVVVSIAAAARGGEGGIIAGALFGFVLIVLFVYNCYVIYTSFIQQNSGSTQDAPGQ